MAPSDISWFKAASMKMEWVSARQKVLAENMANADTPNYVGRDVVSFEDFMKAGSSEGPEVKHAENSWSGSFDGNKINLEEQALLASQASGEFALATSLMRKGHSMLQAASGRK